MVIETLSRPNISQRGATWQVALEPGVDEIESETNETSALQWLNIVPDVDYAVKLTARQQKEAIAMIQQGTQLEWKKFNFSVTGAELTRLVVVKQTRQARIQLDRLMYASSGLFESCVARFMTLNSLFDQPNLFDEFLSVAKISGIKAVYRFSASFNVNYSTYAYCVTHNDLVTYWNHKEKDLSEIDNQAMAVKKVWRYVYLYKKDHSEVEPTADQIAEELKMKRSSVTHILNTPENIMASFDDPVGNEFGSREEKIADENNEILVSIDGMEAEADVATFNEVMKKWDYYIDHMVSTPGYQMNWRRRKDIFLRFFAGERVVDIAREMGVTKQDIDRILKKARNNFVFVARSLGIDQAEWPWLQRFKTKQEKADERKLVVS